MPSADRRIGVDVGGTNTDAIILSGDEVVHSVKTPTTEDATTGIVTAIETVLAESGTAPSGIDAVMVGTTHFINAIVQARDLLQTGVVRLCGGATRAIPPFTDWPTSLRSEIEGETFMAQGGLEFDGRPIAEPDPDELVKIIDDLRKSGLRSAAVVSVFSPVNEEHETKVAQFIEEHLPEVALSLSSEIGSIGLLERENATIMNASLRQIADRVIGGLGETLRRMGLIAELYVSQNDGTLMAGDQVSRYPVMTFASGPTNSMRGAARLSGLADCAVLDIGGTTSDVGILAHGFPREAPVAVDVAGVRTNFRMPDVVSVGLGGGSIVRFDPDLTIGPDSVGYRITEEALVFGGETLTATDIAVAAGMADVGDPSRVRHLDSGMVSDAVDLMTRTLAEAIDRMKTGPEPIPVVVVGGGSIIAPDELPGASKLVKPSFHSVANAVGAAIAEVGGQVDKIVSLDGVDRGQEVELAKGEAIQRAVEAGAVAETVRIVEVVEVPLAYLPGNATRLKVKAVGRMGSVGASAE